MTDKLFDRWHIKRQIYVSSFARCATILSSMGFDALCNVRLDVRYNVRLDVRAWAETSLTLYKAS